MNLSIILVNYNTTGLLVECLGSVRANLQVPEYEIIVVDNASTDFDMEAVTSVAPGARIIRKDRNQGFGAGTNQGVKHARGGYLWLLNSDTLVPPGNRMHRVLDFLDAHLQYAAALPLLTDPQGRAQPGQVAHFPSIPRLIADKPARMIARVLGPPRSSTVFGWVHPDFLPMESRDVDVAVAAALVIRRSVFEAVGGFDERFFMYFEDSDLCRKLCAAGLAVRFMVEARIIHLWGKSTKTTRRRKALYYAGQDAYFRKWHGPSAAAAVRLLRAPLAAWYRLRDA